MLPWQPLFTSSLKNYNFSEVSFTFLYHYFSCSFIDFSYFLVNFGKFQKFWKNQEIQDSGSKMAATLEPDVNVTSYGVISLCCGPQRRHFWMYYLLSKFRCVGLSHNYVWQGTWPHRKKFKNLLINSKGNYSLEMWCINFLKFVLLQMLWCH